MYFDAEQRCFCPCASGFPRRPCCCCNQRSEVNTQYPANNSHDVPDSRVPGEVRRFMLRRRAGFVPSGLGVTPSAPCAAVGCQTRGLIDIRRTRQITHMLTGQPCAGRDCRESRFCTLNRSRDPRARAPCAEGWVSDEKPDRYTRNRAGNSHVDRAAVCWARLQGCVAAQSRFCTLNRSRGSPSAPCAADRSGDGHAGLLAVES